MGEIKRLVLPCPFCGGPAEKVRNYHMSGSCVNCETNKHVHPAIQCLRCGGVMVGKPEQWNKRVSALNALEPCPACQPSGEIVNKLRQAAAISSANADNRNYTCKLSIKDVEQAAARIDALEKLVRVIRKDFILEGDYEQKLAWQEQTNELLGEEGADGQN